jgi:2-iminobutanoate/2-iminopropanoate deaminase
MTTMRLACAAAVALALSVAGCAAPAPRADTAQYLKSAVPNAPFSASVRVGDLVFLSGQIGITADGKLPADFTEQARLTMQNVQAALQQAGLGFDEVFKCTVMLADMSHWDDFNRIYVGYFKPERLPARSALGASGLARGAQVELECTAYAGHHP